MSEEKAEPSKLEKLLADLRMEIQNCANSINARSMYMSALGREGDWHGIMDAAADVREHLAVKQYCEKLLKVYGT